jgi:hypothetical protein
MTNDINQDQLQALQDSLANAEPVPISIHMTKAGFEFVVENLRILDRDKYQKEQGIEFVNKHSTLSKFQARVVYSDGSSKLINLREEK